MMEQKITIPNKLGLHARAAALFCQLAAEFESDIVVIKDKATVNGKSIMELLTLAAAMNTQITIKATGSDEDSALEKLVALVDDKFGESE